MPRGGETISITYFVGNHLYTNAMHVIHTARSKYARKYITKVTPLNSE